MNFDLGELGEITFADLDIESFEYRNNFNEVIKEMKEKIFVLEKYSTFNVTWNCGNCDGVALNPTESWCFSCAREEYEKESKRYEDEQNLITDIKEKIDAQPSKSLSEEEKKLLESARVLCLHIMKQRETTNVCWKPMRKIDVNNPEHMKKLFKKTMAYYKALINDERLNYDFIYLTTMGYISPVFGNNEPTN
jgi:hypothetical protein